MSNIPNDIKKMWEQAANLKENAARDAEIARAVARGGAVGQDALDKIWKADAAKKKEDRERANRETMGGYNTRLNGDPGPDAY